MGIVATVDAPTSRLKAAEGRTGHFSMPSLARADHAAACQEACGLGSIGRTAGASYKRQNKRPSLIPREFEAAPRGGGGAVVAAGAKFDAPVDDAEVEPVDEAAIATLLTKVAHARPRPFAI